MTLRKLKFIGLGFLTISGLFITLGLCTYIWTPVDGKIEKLSMRGISSGGSAGYRGIGISGGGSAGTWQSIEYSYEHNGVDYRNSMVSVGLPIGKVDISYASYTYEMLDEITVYVFPYYPSISVAARGVDPLLGWFFLMVGVCVLWFRRYVLKTNRLTY